MRTLLSLAIIVGLSLFYFNYTSIDKTVVNKTTNVDTTNVIEQTDVNTTNPETTGDDLDCVEIVELDEVVNLNKFSKKDKKILKQTKYLGNPYINKISFKRLVTIIDLSNNLYDKKIFKTEDKLIVTSKDLSTDNCETILCDYKTKTCDVYANFFVTDAISSNELEVFVYENDTTIVHDEHYISNNELRRFDLNTNKLYIIY